MDQVKTGKFISQLRKEKSLTQAQLAEMLGITDRAVSKWETGRSLPDSSIMLELCEILEINVNELLSGERLVMENYNRKLEENLIEMKKREEESNKYLLRLEMVIGYVCSITFIIMTFTASFVTMALAWKLLLIISGMIIFAVGMYFAMKLERETGYYECSHCHHKYVPQKAPFMFSMHIFRTRYMKCPMCQKYSWQRKILTK